MISHYQRHYYLVVQMGNADETQSSVRGQPTPHLIQMHKNQYLSKQDIKN